jgi:hypothetical protein
MNPEKYKLLKQRLRQVIAENELLHDKLQALKSSNSFLKKERDLMMGKVPDESSDSEEVVTDDKKRKRPVKIKKYYDIPRNPEGELILPFQLGIITLENLGTVVWDRPSFHNDRYIYPIGFSTTREFSSMYTPDKMVRYKSEIIDGGDGPRFQVTPADGNKPIVASTATGAWTTIIKGCVSNLAVNLTRNREHSNSASGPDYFGLSHGTIMKLIQELPNADKCTNYTHQVVIIFKLV